MPKLLTLFFATLFATEFLSPLLANDSAISGVSGTPGNLKAVQLTGEHKSVRMVREQIEVKIGRVDYVTEARFVFRNDGLATTVRMGFPESSAGDTDVAELRKQSAFREFRTWVDGTEVQATRYIAGDNLDDFTFDAFWVKAVSFKRGQTRNVRVRYRSPLGVSTDGDFVSYDFTGGNWKGTVDQSTLRLIYSAPGTYRLFPLSSELGKYSRRDSGNSVLLTWRNWQAQAGFSLRYLRTLPNGLMRASEEKDLGEVWDTYADLKTLTVHGAGEFDPWQSETNWPPSAVLRDGRTFIQFRQLSEIMREKWEQSENGGRSASPGAGLQKIDDMVLAPYYGQGSKVIAVYVGRKTAVVGGRTIALPEAPFVAGGALYVPLVSLVEALGGTAKVNLSARRFWFDVPV